MLLHKQPVHSISHHSMGQGAIDILGQGNKHRPQRLLQLLQAMIVVAHKLKIASKLMKQHPLDVLLAQNLRIHKLVAIEAHQGAKANAKGQ
jgi:hypothetical protein